MTFEKSADKIMLLRVSDVAHGALVKNATVKKKDYLMTLLMKRLEK